MAGLSEQPAACAFCGSTAVRQTHHGLYHTFNKDYGPFDFHQCLDCGSGLTLIPPSLEQLTALYASYDDGLPDLHREITREDPQAGFYRLCARRAFRLAQKPERPTWIDVGAGGGELSEIMSELAPGGRGIAIDLHRRPQRLDGREAIEWIELDINRQDFTNAARLRGAADVVLSIAVWEHVVHPDRYARELIKLLKPGGLLYLVCPNYGSVARRIMGERWPYFTPGEHLNMPTPRGARACLSRQWRTLHPGADEPSRLQRTDRAALFVPLRSQTLRFRLFR